ncbi:MAG TPA: OsmC family protein [Vicinamibacteria bacterium]
MARVTVRSERGLRQRVEAGRHVFAVDEPVSSGGGDAGPDPYALLLAALGSCTSMTLRLYAERKKWPLGEVVVELSHSRTHADDCAGCERPDAMVDRIDRRILLSGPLDAEQTARLAEIARKCPVHKTLTAGVAVVDTVQVL